jgi:hypothetical protein
MRIPVLIYLAPFLLLCCDRKGKDLAKSTAPDDAPVPTETPTGGVTTGRAPKPEPTPTPGRKPNDYPLFQGRGKRVIDPDSAEFRKIIREVLALKGGHAHQVMFAIELEQGGIEVKTEKIGEGYGWTILLEVKGDGEVAILKQEHWRR